MTGENKCIDAGANFNPSNFTYDYQLLRSCLEEFNWKTPESYCNAFADAGDFSAVYLFLMVDSVNFKRCLPAYVGMSTRLSQRWSGHNIIPELKFNQIWVQRWFLKVPTPDLRAVESRYIQTLNPPWNIVGRSRGVQK